MVDLKTSQGTPGQPQGIPEHPRASQSIPGHPRASQGIPGHLRASQGGQLEQISVARIVDVTRGVVQRITVSVVEI